jgi:hypothetical protein
VFCDLNKSLYPNQSPPTHTLVPENIAKNIQVNKKIKSIDLFSFFRKEEKRCKKRRTEYITMYITGKLFITLKTIIYIFNAKKIINFSNNLL